MRIKVYPGPFCDSKALDEEGYLEMYEGATVGDALKKLRYSLPVRVFGLYMVNYQKVRLDTKLKDGDIVSIITPAVGG